MYVLINNYKKFMPACTGEPPKFIYIYKLKV